MLLRKKEYAGSSGKMVESGGTLVTKNTMPPDWKGAEENHAGM
jgi:hypothetical protein